MTQIPLINNSFDVCSCKTVYVRSDSKIIGTCITCVKKWIFYTALPGDDTGEWFTIDQMKQQYNNLEFFIEC